MSAVSNSAKADDGLPDPEEREKPEWEVACNAQSIKALADPIEPKMQQEWSVAGQTGLLIVAGRGGARTWFLRYAFRRKRHKLRLDGYPKMSLASAVKKAAGYRYEIRVHGIDPKGAAPEEEAGTFAELSARYLKDRSTGRQKLAATTRKEWIRILDCAELNNLRTMAPADITDVHIARCLDPFEDRDAMVMLNRVQEVISAVMRHGVTRKLYGLKVNPVRGMERRYQQGERDRHLDAAEIAAVWHDLEGRPPLLRASLRLILLTGQRPGEVRRMEQGHIDGSIWKMPAGYRKRTRADKGRPSRQHKVPLSKLALTELERVRGYER